MARPRQGIGFEQNGVVYAGIRLADGKRYAWRVEQTDPPPEGIALGVPWAKAVSLARQAAYDRGAWDPKGTAPAPQPQETVALWSERWLEARRASGLRSVGDDEGRLKNHVLPVIGAEPVATVSRARIEDVRDELDAKVRREEISAATASKVWGVVTKAFTDARASKDRALRVREDNPCTDVEPPDRAPEREGPVLYPGELLALVSCERVPLRWRQLFALAVYTAGRAAELEAFELDGVDLERGTLLIHSAADRKTGEARRTKTGIVRRIPLEAAIVPLVEVLVRDAKAAGRVRLIATMPPREDGAAYLRACLGYAGVTRAELFIDDETRRPICFHDLRATGITWQAARGDNPLQIQRRAGHTTFSTTEGYIRLAEGLGAVGAVFPPLPASLLGAGAVPGSVTGSVTEKSERPGTSEIPGLSVVTPTGFEGVPRSRDVGKCAKRRHSARCSLPFETPPGRFVTGSVTAVTLVEDVRRALAEATERGWGWTVGEA